MSEKPLTAAAIVEANREYWRRPDVIERGRRFCEFLDSVSLRIQDIVLKRVKDGWPTRDAASPEEDC